MKEKGDRLMQIRKNLVLWLFLILVIGMIGCSSGGSSSGSSSPSSSTPASTTNPLVGTWRPDSGGATVTLNADGSGSMSDGHSISGWTLSSSNVLDMKINGTPEKFQLTWTNDAKTKLNLTNIGPNSSETTAYTKS
jgi:hypothetical protein